MRAIDDDEVGEVVVDDGSSCLLGALRVPDIVPRSLHVLPPSTLTAL